MLKAMKQPKGFYKGVFALMLPMILQNVITQTVSFADTFMVGLLGEQNLAAVTTAVTPFFVIMLLMMGIQSGAGILISQYWGKGNLNAINRVLGVGFYFSSAFSFIGAMLMFFFPEFFLSIITNDAEVVALAVNYAKIAGFAHMCNSISGVYIAAHRSMENARLGVVVLTLSSLINVLGNWLLIFGKLGFPAMGITGAAVATLISRIVELVIVLIYAAKNKRFKIIPKSLFKPGLVILKDFLKYSLPVILNEALWGFGAMIYPIILGHMENSMVILAAYTISGNIERLFGVAVFAGGGAASVIIGREIGAGRKDTVYSAGKALVMLSFFMGLASAALLFVATLIIMEPYIFPLFKLSEAAAEACTIMLTIMSFVMIIRTVGFTMSIGVLRGGGDVRAVMYIDIGSLYLVALPAAAISAFVFGAGIAVVYGCIALEDIIKTILSLFRFRSKKWINDVTREAVA
ncbi:MAG: MATE family efflux transporter [Clostridiales bacterium]|jgi:putative MATE family efflux protein|nr:MATE family efflux transporter [Clostridiales bacterium]